MNAKIIKTDADLKKALDIRQKVFVEEQNVPLADEFDEFDTLGESCQHILAHYNEQPVGTGRLRIVNGAGKLERICILKPYRQDGLGKIIINKLEEIAKAKGISQVKLHGQTHAEEFYKKLNYQTASDEFTEDGIPHILMTKTF